MKAQRISNSRRFDRRSATQQAMQAAAALRARIGVSQNVPLCIYDACHQAGVTVRFNDINMEGMYQKAARPIIHVSSKRPLPRRAFNCAHELGHHEFGHGSSIDELRKDAHNPSWDDPKEFLADSFAGHLLMPAIALRGAFNARGLSPETATPEQLYVIACDFGVGYRTLITHLSAGLKLLSKSRTAELKRHSPKTIRARLLQDDTEAPLVVAGARRLNPRIDVEVGTLVLLPHDTVVEAGKLVPVRKLKNAILFEAVAPGIAQIRAPEWAAFVRIARKEYTGLALYRHLEECDD